ncbi:hypothetical protein LCGC14_2369590, partial [marine sediment metagenome]
PTGQVTLRLNGVLFAQAPTFPTGDVQPQPVTLNGVLFTRAPTFPAGSISLQLNGVLFTRAPTFATGQVNLQLNGILFTRAGVFPTGAVNAQPVTLNGVLFTRAPTFPVGDVSLAGGDQTINGVLFAKAPTFPTGQINLRVFGSDTQFLSIFPPDIANHRVDTPDHADLDIVGDLELQVRASRPDWTFFDSIVGKWSATSAEQSYRVRIQTDGKLALIWKDSSNVSHTVISTVSPGFVDNEVNWFKFELDVDNGAAGHDVLFYTGGSGEDPTFVQLGTTVTTAGTTDIQVGNATFSVGEQPGQIGKVGHWYQVKVFDGIGGTLAAHFDADDFTLGDSDLDTAVGAAGKTWTIRGSECEIQAGSLRNHPTFPAGSVAAVLAGVLFTRAPTFATGQVNLQLNGVLFTRAPTFPTGDISAAADQTITGILFTRAPTFPTGQVTLQLFGAATFQLAPTFATGSVTLQLVGVLFTRAPTFPTGAIQAQPVTINGVLFTLAPTFPTGVMRLAALTFWVDDKVVQTSSSPGGDNKVAYTKLEPSAPNPL